MSRTEERPEPTAGVPLGDVRPAGTRHLWRRSAVALAGTRALVGTVGGQVSAVPTDAGVDTSRAEWTTGIDDEYAVSITTDGPGGTIAVGGRGENGTVTVLDAASGEPRWRYRSADDLGGAPREGLFSLPYVVDVATDGERVYAAARRYEREGARRAFRSAVYAFEPDGSVRWTYRADASPITIDLRGGRLAVAYNRCPGEHDHGLVVLDTATGDERLTWDIAAAGDRRIGDVAVLPEGVAVASHGDHRGYRLDDAGRERWSVDLARPVEIGEETLYAYPNHVRATGDGVAFVTGNTYPEEGREAMGRHPREHVIVAVGPDGTERWHASVGGWVSELVGDGETVAAPCAGRFRDRDSTAHGFRLYGVTGGSTQEYPTEGIATAAALNDRLAAVVEEPVKYHDGDAIRGEYRLHVLDR